MNTDNLPEITVKVVTKDNSLWVFADSAALALDFKDTDTFLRTVDDRGKSTHNGRVIINHDAFLKALYLHSKERGRCE